MDQQKKDLPRGVKDLTATAHEYLLLKDERYARLFAQSLLKEKLLEENRNIFPFDGVYHKPATLIAQVDAFFVEGEFSLRMFNLILSENKAEKGEEEKAFVMVLDLDRLGQYCLKQEDPRRAIIKEGSESVLKDIVFEAKDLQTKLVKDIQAAPNPSPRLMANLARAFNPKQVDRPRTA
jgi:hypothetical protein